MTFPCEFIREAGSPGNVLSSGIKSNEIPHISKPHMPSSGVELEQAWDESLVAIPCSSQVRAPLTLRSLARDRASVTELFPGAVIHRKPTHADGPGKRLRPICHRSYPNLPRLSGA